MFVDRLNNVIDFLLTRAALRRLRRAENRAPNADLASLRTLRKQALRLRNRANRVVHLADARLTLPLLGTNAIQKPLHTDWAWRPKLWSGPINPAGIVAAKSETQFGGEVTLFHDCTVSELTLRQIRNTREDDLAPFGLRMDVFAFDGSFLSLAVELPQRAVRGLRKRHLVRLTTTIEREKPLEIFARLNIRHGPNTEKIVRELPSDSEEVFVEFDLAYSNLNEKRVEHAWIDLIFEGPEMNQIILRDVTLTRRPRAEL